MSLRQKKVESLIQETLSTIFLQKIDNSEFGLITITNTKISPDLKIAKIYLSVYEKEKREDVLEYVESRKGFIRSELSKKINLRATPELNFYIDDTLDYVEKMNKIFSSIKNDNRETNENN